MKNAKWRENGLARAQAQREYWAEKLADQDREILALRAEGKTFRAIGVILGISHQGAGHRVRAAQRREVTRNSAST